MFLVLYSFTTIIVIVTFLFAALNLKTPVKFIVRFWAKTSFLIMMKRVRIIGKHYIDREQKYILIANHASLFDILAIMAFYPNVAFFGKEYLVKIPIFGRLLKMINFVPMRSTNLRNTKEMLDQLLEKSKGLTVAIFPEGTRTRTGEFNRFRKGFVHLIRATEHPILPVTLKGFYHLKPANRFHINFRSKLRVIIHPPIDNSFLSLKQDNEIVDVVRSIIESAYVTT